MGSDPQSYLINLDKLAGKTDAKGPSPAAPKEPWHTSLGGKKVKDYRPVAKELAEALQRFGEGIHELFHECEPLYVREALDKARAEGLLS